jgi:hypothetical protein
MDPRKYFQVPWKSFYGPIAIIPWTDGNHSEHPWKSFTRSMEVVIVLDLVSQVRNVVLMNVYLDLENPGGPGFWNGGYMSQGREMGR